MRVLTPKDSNLVWRELVTYLQEIIRLYPVFGSVGQELAQSKIASFLRSNSWDTVIEDNFSARDISHLGAYIPVEEFSPQFKHYPSVTKKNVIAIVDGSAPGKTLILNGHTDVDGVYDQDLWEKKKGYHSGEIDSGRMYGRGASDMLGGLFSLIEVGTYFAQRKDQWRGRIILTAVVDEEIGGNGTLRALEYLKSLSVLESSPVEVLIAEPSDRVVCTETLGFLTGKIQLFRSKCHMGAATQEDSVIHELVLFYASLEASLRKEVLQRGFSLQEDYIKCNLGMLSGGSDPALPMGDLIIDFTVFYPSGIDRESIQLILNKVICDFVRSDTQCKVVYGKVSFEASSFQSSKLLDDILSTASREIKGPGIFPSPCDARLFESYGFPTVVYGPGSLQQAHATNEFIELGELDRYRSHLRDALTKLLSMNTPELSNQGVGSVT